MRSSREGFRVLQRLQTAPVYPAGAHGAGLGPAGLGPPGPEPGPRACRGMSGSMNVFNRQMKRRQKNWAASLQDGQQYDYLRDEVRGRGQLDAN